MTKGRKEKKKKEIEKSKKQQQSPHSTASLVVAGGNSRRLYSCGKLAIIWCILAQFSELDSSKESRLSIVLYTRLYASTFT